MKKTWFAYFILMLGSACWGCGEQDEPPPPPSTTPPSTEATDHGSATKSPTPQSPDGDRASMQDTSQQEPTSQDGQVVEEKPVNDAPEELKDE